eukprot:8679425-Karenia_brevis.AAC.1
MPLLNPSTTILLSDHTITAVTFWPKCSTASKALMTAVSSALGTVWLPSRVPYSPKQPTGA